MTSQMTDRFLYGGDPFDLVGMHGEGLFDPRVDFNLNPSSASTACWRGFIMEYDCVDGKLVLNKMHINVANAPEINGVKPKGPGEHDLSRLFKALYEDLKLKTHFTGTLLLAKDFIDSMYVHMGFQRPMAYKTVLEIHVKDGNITGERDLSGRMEELRERDRNKGALPDSESEKDIQDWIAKTFSLDYDFD